MRGTSSSLLQVVIAKAWWHFCLAAAHVTRFAGSDVGSWWRARVRGCPLNEEVGQRRRPPLTPEKVGWLVAPCVVELGIPRHVMALSWRMMVTVVFGPMRDGGFLG